MFFFFFMIRFLVFFSLVFFFFGGIVQIVPPGPIPAHQVANPPGTYTIVSRGGGLLKVISFQNRTQRF